MEDNNNIPQLEEPINDDLEPNGVILEKPYYNNQPQFQSTNNNPVQNDIPDNNQLQYYSPPFSDGTEQIYQDQERRNCLCCDQKKFLIVLSIILFIVVFTEVGLQIHFNYFSLYLCIDDILILTMAIIYIVFTIKGKPVMNYWIGTPTVLIWFVGIGLRIKALAILREGIMFGVDLISGIIRCIDMYFCMTLTCKVTE